MVRRFLLGFLFLTAFIVPVLEVPLGLNYASNQVDQLTSQVTRDAFFLASYSEDTLEGRAPDTLSNVVANYENRTGGRVVVVRTGGAVLVDSDPPVPGARSFASRPEIGRALGGEVATGTRYSNTLKLNLLYVAVPVTSGSQVIGAVRITYPRSKIDHQIRRHWLTLAAVALLSLLSAAIVAVIVARSVARPLLRVRQAALQLGEGDLSTRAPDDSGPPEIRQLAGALNDTAVRLQHMVGAQEAFVADASHQLRTPLTALQLRLENLGAEVGQEQRDDLLAAEDEVARLSRMVDGLLSLARAERTAAGTSAVATDALAMLEDRRAAWALVTDEHEMNLIIEGDESVRVMVTPGRLDQIIDNLLANAIDASPPGGRITLRVDREGQEGVIKVIDGGRGLSREDREHAFDRFWRASRPPAPYANAAPLGGSGLGLSIVRKLVELDAGSVALEPGPNGRGITAVVRFPLADT